MPATLAHGKICHIEIPAIDHRRSAAFYAEVFGWHTKQDEGGGPISFDDPTEEVSGHWVSREPSEAPGLLFYIWVDSVRDAMLAVAAHGGQIVQEIGGDAPEITARFLDPAGNVIGLYEEPAGEQRR